jgi:hypothetical protein
MALPYILFTSSMANITDVGSGSGEVGSGEGAPEEVWIPLLSLASIVVLGTVSVTAFMLHKVYCSSIRPTPTATATVRA